MAQTVLDVIVANARLGFTPWSWGVDNGAVTIAVEAICDPDGEHVMLFVHVSTPDKHAVVPAITLGATWLAQSPKLIKQAIEDAEAGRYYMEVPKVSTQKQKSTPNYNVN